MNTFKRSILSVGCIIFAMRFSVYAISSTSQVASEGQLLPKTVVETYGWPAGVLDLVNDPLRSNGWNPWFSEWPNDVNHYEIELRGQRDLQRVVQKLSAIRGGSGVRLLLDPGKEPGALGFTATLPQGNGTAAVFAIGSQKMIDQWFEGLPETEPGVRTFGVQRYTESPKALPPTLTLFVGHHAIDLAKLEVPTSIEISGTFSDAYRKEHKDDPMVTAIDTFITVHKKKQGTAQTSNMKTE